MRITPRNLLSGVATVVAAGALAIAAPSAASALTYTPGSPVSNGSTVSITSTGALAAGTYTLGVCTKATFGGVPACSSQGTATLAAPGTLTGSIVAEKNGLNAHDGVTPTQPATVDCAVSTACEIVIVSHSTRTIVERSNIAFS